MCVCVYWQDSLAAEIEGTMRKEMSLDDPECEEQKYGPPFPHLRGFNQGLYEMD